MGQEREKRSTTEPLAPLDARSDVCKDGATDAELRAKVAAAVIAGDDVEAARLMALLGKPKPRMLRG